MRKLLIVSILLIFVVSNVFAYSIKVYDEYGNRVGTYRKEGDKYQVYDFNDKKIDRPEALIKDAPTDKTLTEYTQTFYDENMMPIGTWRSGFYGNDGRYYPRGYLYPGAFYKSRTPQIVRPRADINNYYNRINREKGMHYIDTRYPSFHEFKN